MSGGQKILQGIQHNRNLVSLNLKGNCVPGEIHSAIKEQIAENQKRRILCETPMLIKENLRPASLSSEEDADQASLLVRSRLVKRKKKRERSKTPLEELSRNSPLGDSGNNDDNVLDVRGLAEKTSNEGNYVTEFEEKIQGLNQILQERSAAIDLLTTELESKSMDLKLSKTANDELKAEIQRLREENATVVEEKTRDLESMKKAQTKTEASWKESYAELEESHQTNLRLKQEADARIRAYERELRKSSLEIQSLKDKLTSTVQSYEDTVSECRTEVHRTKRELQERDNRCKIETNALKDSLKESTEALEKCQEQLQRLRNELREALEAQARLRTKADESERLASRTARVEDALSRSKEEREKLEEKLQESRRAVAAFQKQVIRLQEEAMEPQKRYEALRLELQLEREKTAGLRLELQEERVRQREHSDQVQKMLGQINGLYGQIGEAQSGHAEALRAKEAEIEKLRSVVAQKSRELDEFRYVFCAWYFIFVSMSHGSAADGQYEQ